MGLNVKTGCGLLVLNEMRGRGELREDNEEELPIPSLEDWMFSCSNILRHVPVSPRSRAGKSLSSREELEPLNTLLFCWSSDGGETRGETGVTFRLLL